MFSLSFNPGFYPPLYPSAIYFPVHECCKFLSLVWLTNSGYHQPYTTPPPLIVFSPFTAGFLYLIQINSHSLCYPKRFVPQPSAFVPQSCILVLQAADRVSLIGAQTAALLHPVSPDRYLRLQWCSTHLSVCWSRAKLQLSACGLQLPPLQLHQLWCQWLPILWPESPCHSRTFLDYDID